MATIDTTSSKLEELLGDDAGDLLGHTCQTIDKSQLYLPGPDFLDRTLLDSERRPTYFQRSYDGSGYDYDDLGWPWTELGSGHASEPDAARRKLIYDTTLPGYSNVGHTFGDVLDDEERTAVIEYLKTL